MRLQDLSGQRFGRLVVIGRDLSNKSKRVYWICKCDCGGVKSIEGTRLKNKNTVSCGCFRREESANRKTTHNLTNTPLYAEWARIKRRCYNKNMKCYKDYGGRGITVCKEWLNDPASFIEWSKSHGYHEGLSLDRIDNNGGYSPDNCRWTTKKVQANNTRRNHYITFNKETHTLSEWSEKMNINYSVLKYRIKSGWSVEKAFNTPIEIKYSHKRG